jgi:hypothetical protein
MTMLLLPIYRIPLLIAEMRGHPQHVAILSLNVLLGWTVIGWVVALVWAATAIDKTRTTH